MSKRARHFGLTRRQLLGGLGSALIPAAVRGAGRAAETRQAVVAGAGLSGLYAALLLEELGFDTLVLEASGRVGGRLLTLDHLPGAPEAGGQMIGPMYSRVLGLLRRLELSFMDRLSLFPGAAYYLGGGLHSAADLAERPHPGLTAAERSVPLGRLYRYYVEQVDPLPDLNSWRDPQFLAQDDRSIGAVIAEAGASAEALRLMERWFDGGGLRNMSALFAFRKHQAAKLEKTVYAVRGGSMRLPEAMAAQLKTPPRLNSPVVAIRESGGLVALRCADGSEVRAPHAFISIPFSVLRDIPIEPKPSGALAKAIQQLPYNHITQVKIGFNEHFWEDDGLPPAMYADSFIERVTATPGQDGRVHHLNVWIKGLQAAALDRLDDQALAAQVVAELERIRPAAKGRIRADHVMAWGRNPYAKGAYHFYGVGGARAYSQALFQPHGRMHWIGEHATQFQHGMEGACESAEREVFAMLETL